MNKIFLQLLNGAEDKYPTALEKKFPHIFNKLIELWNKPDIDAYFSELMLYTRGESRQGFPNDVAKEILNLSTLHDGQRKKP